MKQILGLIPARGGSKTVPQKNIRQLLGKPLIAYTIIEALKSKLLNKVMVSSDDAEIIEISRKYGAEVPFVRPAELATDESLAIYTVKHAVEFMEQKDSVKYDYVALLQPTAPMRKAKDIDRAINKMLELKADSIASVVDVGAYHPARMKKIVDERLVNILDESLTYVRKQDLPKVYIFNGAIYVARRDIIFERDSFQGDRYVAYIMPAERSANIDTELDFIMAEILMQRY
ncbi:cytidylyltransferase domain-containing protein [Chloroflexota bacterium]